MGTETAVTVTSTVTSTSAERDAGAANTYTSSVTIIRTDEGADGSPGSPGSPGSAGAAGPKTATGQIFYNTEQANAPNAPSNTSVSFNSWKHSLHSKLLYLCVNSSPTFISLIAYISKVSAI